MRATNAHCHVHFVLDDEVTCRLAPYTAVVVTYIGPREEGGSFRRILGGGKLAKSLPLRSTKSTPKGRMPLTKDVVDISVSRLDDKNFLPAIDRNVMALSYRDNIL